MLFRHSAPKRAPATPLPEPDLVSISPTHGVATDTITLTGSGFVDDLSQPVTIGGIAVDNKSVNANKLEITCDVPSGLLHNTASNGYFDVAVGGSVLTEAFFIDVEPTYNASVHNLLDQEDFDSFTAVGNDGGTGLVDKYNSGRVRVYDSSLGFVDGVGVAPGLLRVPEDDSWADAEAKGTIKLVTPGRGGSGQCVRISYGGYNDATTVDPGANDLIFGSRASNQVGELDGTLPEVSAPWTHYYNTMWFRTSLNADPSSGNTSSIKGFMHWKNPSNNRVEWRPCKLRIGGTRWDGTHDNVGDEDDGTQRWQPTSGWPENAYTTLNSWRTADGYPPKWDGIYNDNNWHRITYEQYTQYDPSGHAGMRLWLDGTLVFDCVDEVPAMMMPNDPNTGLPWQTSGLVQHTFDDPTGVDSWSVWGNFVIAEAANDTTNFKIDFDDWTVWTD